MAILTIILASLIITYFLIYKKPKEKEINEKDEIIIDKKIEKEESAKMVQIDIKGQVLSPGLYSLDENSRIMDAIKLAGGLTEQADTSVINLSKKVTDEMVIIIYSKEEVANFKEIKEQEQQIQEKCQQKEDDSLINNACITSEETITGEKYPLIKPL